jgi:hypothetical protein
MTIEEAQQFVYRASKHGFRAGEDLIAAPVGGYFMRVAREGETPDVPFGGTTVGLSGQEEKISVSSDTTTVGQQASGEWFVRLEGIRRDRDAARLREFVTAELDHFEYEADGANYTFNNVVFADDE